MTGATTEYSGNDSAPQVSGTKVAEMDGLGSEDTQRPLLDLAKQMANLEEIEVCHSTALSLCDRNDPVC